MTTLRLHGSPAIHRAEHASLTLSAREAALLAWLYLEGPTPRGKLAGLLWPDGNEGKARANLRQLLLRLRRAAGDVLAEHEGVLSLHPDLGIAAPEGRLLGPLEFDDAPELADWLDAHREAQRRTQLREGLAAAREALGAGRLDAALTAADRVLLMDPAAEEAHRLRMEVFWRRGDRAAAIQAWDDCRLALRQQFGVPPSAVTNELGHRILAEEAAVQSPVAGAGLPEALRRPPRLIGRESELALMVQALQAGKGVVLRGAGGVGKSRLMAAVAERMEPSLSVGGRPGDEHVPGSVASRLVAAAIARFEPELDALTRADIQRLLPQSGVEPAQMQSALEHQRVLASVARTMLACHRKGMRLVVVDDLQFADDLSMDAIAVVIGGWLADPPPDAAVPLFGCRPEELREPARRLVHMIEGSGKGLRVDLQPLDLARIESLLATLPLPAVFAAQHRALAKALLSRVGGNPAYLVESLKTLWRQAPAAWSAGDALPLPDSLLAQMRERLGRLSPEALQLAQLAAVSQRDFSLPLAALSLGRAPLALAPLFAELDGAEVFQGGGFAHDLVAEAVNASLPDSLRAPLHRLVAEHLQAQQGEPGSIAHHLDSAGEPKSAAAWHWRAGDQAKDQWRLSDAAQHFEAAARALSSAEIGQERELRLASLRGAASARIGLGQMVQGERLLDEARTLCRTFIEEVSVLNSCVTVWLSRRQIPALRAGATRLCELLKTGSVDLPIQERERACMTLAIGARFTRLAPVLLQLGPSFGRTGATPPTLPERIARGMLMRIAGDAMGARECLAAAVWEAIDRRKFSHAYNGAHQWVRAGFALGDAGTLDAALAAIRRCVQEAGLGPGLSVDVQQLEAMRCVSVGDPASAEPIIEAARSTLAALPGAIPRVQIEVVAALVQALRGRLDEAQSRLDALAPADHGPDADQTVRFWACAQIAARAGRPVEPWLERARAVDPNGAPGADSLDTRYLAWLLAPPRDPKVRDEQRIALVREALQTGRLPLLHGLQAAAAHGAPGLVDPWLAACA